MAPDLSRMYRDVSATKQDSIEAQSERLKEMSQLLQNRIEDFLKSGKTEGNLKAMPTPQLAALDNIADNLGLAEQALKSANDFFDRLTARIRN